MSDLFDLGDAVYSFEPLIDVLVLCPCFAVQHVVGQLKEDKDVWDGNIVSCDVFVPVFLQYLLEFVELGHHS